MLGIETVTGLEQSTRRPVEKATAQTVPSAGASRITSQDKAQVSGMPAVAMFLAKEKKKIVDSLHYS